VIKGIYNTLHKVDQHAEYVHDVRMEHVPVIRYRAGYRVGTPAAKIAPQAADVASKVAAPAVLKQEVAPMDSVNVINESAPKRRGDIEETARPLTAPEKAFWKDALMARAQSTLLRNNGKRLVPEATADLCANFADAAMDVYRSRVIWRKPG
jgi:hypothetical protein